MRFTNPLSFIFLWAAMTHNVQATVPCPPQRFLCLMKTERLYTNELVNNLLGTNEAGMERTQLRKAKQ
jgi:hypothetical protein